MESRELLMSETYTLFDETSCSHADTSQGIRRVALLRRIRSDVARIITTGLVKHDDQG